jgi:sulfite exporter TauE/SafE
MLMLAFGVGTLPMLLVIGGFAEKLQRFTRHKWTRYAAGILLIVFGAMILSKALGGGHTMKYDMHKANHDIVHTQNNLS